MRISADIIDEDSSAYNPVSELTTALQARRQRDDQDSTRSVSRHSIKLPIPIPMIRKRKNAGIIMKKNQKMHEMTQQFKNLHVSEMFPYSPTKSNFSLPDHVSKYRPMEKADGDIAGTSKDLDGAPAWLLQYLSQMKHDIKKEVIEELICVTQDDAQSVKTARTTKSEEMHPFKGEVIHDGIFCDNCDQLIHGIRYKCGYCSDFDLCQECESLPNIHNKNHIFLKIRCPVACTPYQKLKWQELMSPLHNKVFTANSRKQPKKLYEAKFFCDETVPDGTILQPSAKFVKSWRVVNSGTRAWTNATKLHLIQGSAELIPISEQVDVPHLKPGEEGIVSVLFCAPATQGVYRSHWNFCHKNRPFGHIVWCHIIVKDEDVKIKNLDVAEKLNNPVVDLQSEKDVDNQQKEGVNIEQVLTAVKEEHERGNMVPRKLAVNSHTTTPNNTPFDLTPPKSPDHEVAIKKHQKVSANDESCSSDSKLVHDSDNEDECSIVSLSSSESDTEFVVIPMPKCFNLSESYISRYIPHLAHHLQSETDADNAEKMPVKEKSEQSEDLANKTRKFSSETVSQETGVPELLECGKLREIVETVRGLEKKISILHITGDGSSSEISIIESEDNSPTEETAMPTINSISIAVSNEVQPKPAVLCELKFPVPEVFEAQMSEEIVKVEETENEEQSSDILCSATFPKFPVENITSTYDPATPCQEERTIQVLPEGLVTGALSAAASVYNTARAVISTIQQPRNDRGPCLSQELPDAPVIRHDPCTGTAQSTHLGPMDHLVEMGFCNRQQNEQLLKKHNGDVPLVVAELVSLSDNDWYASRHVPPHPVDFD